MAKDKSPSMFNKGINILIRRLWINRSFSFLNILGFAIGISASLLIFLVIRYETGFDRWHANNKRIYRIVTSLKTNSTGETGYNGCTPLPLSAALRGELPQFEQVAAVWSVEEAQFAI